MSNAKRQLEEIESKRNNAIGWCMDVGVMEECEYHEELYVTETYEADELVEKILEKSPDAIKDFDNRDEMVEYIEDVMLDHYECTGCMGQGDD